MKKEIVYDCPVVISSVIISERKFAKYRKVAKKAAEDLGYKVHLNNEDDASNQSGFNEILNTKNPIVIALFGKIKSKTVIEECKLALKNNLHIIPLYKKYSQKANADNITKEYICEISLPMYNNDCHHFINCKDLYKHVKQALIEYQNKIMIPTDLARGHTTVYSTAQNLLEKSRNEFILCQKTSTLLLGPHAGMSDEKSFYINLIKKITATKTSTQIHNDIKFKHFFSLTETKNAIQNENKYDINRAKENFINLFSDTTNIDVEFIDIDWTDNSAPFIVSDGNILANLFFINKEVNFLIKRHTFCPNSLKAVIEEIERSGNVYFGKKIGDLIKIIYGDN